MSARLLVFAILSLGSLPISADGPVMIVYDASGSMWGQVDGKAKVEIAREVLGDLLTDWQEDQPVGLTAYGHREKGSCADIEIVVSPSSGAAAEVAERVEGITLGSDVDICKAKGLEVKLADMSFLPYPDGEFDLIFARHTLEHSPAPLLSLMEWRRVSKQWLLLVLPNPKHYKYGGKNHYYVFIKEQVENILDHAGWRAIWRDKAEDTELRVFCSKVKR